MEFMFLNTGVSLCLSHGVDVIHFCTVAVIIQDVQFRPLFLIFSSLHSVHTGIFILF